MTCPRWCNLAHPTGQPHSALFAAEVGTGHYMSVQVRQALDASVPVLTLSRDEVNVDSDDAPAPSGSLPKHLTFGEADALAIALDVALSAVDAERSYATT